MANESGGREGSSKNEYLKRKLAENYRFVFQRLASEEEKGLRYAVVGGVALAAYSGEIEYAYIRENGTIRDLDIMVLEDPGQKMRSLEGEFQLKKDEFILPISLNDTKDENYRSDLQILTHFKKKADGYYLVFRDIETKIPDGLLETREIELPLDKEALKFKTFEPSMILHLYLQRTGIVRPKDKHKIVRFLRHNNELRENAQKPERHQQYRFFHDFVRKLRKKYPAYHSVIKLYNFLDHSVFNSLIIDKFVSLSLRKPLIDR